MRRALTALAALALLAAGCGEDAAEVGPLPAAAERTAHEETLRFFMAIDVDTRAEGQMRMEGTGVATADHSRGRYAGAVEHDGVKLRTEVISIRDEFWVRSEDAELPPGKRWMHSVDRTVAPRTMTLRELLALIRESGDVRAVGGERVRGRSTTHYEASVTVRDVLDNSPRETRERLREQLAPFEDMELPIDVWIDGEDLLRRIDVLFARGDESVRLRVEILEYGVEVDAEPPPAAQVVEESEVLP